MSKVWLSISFAQPADFIRFLANPGSLRLDEVTHTEDVSQVLDVIKTIKSPEVGRPAPTLLPVIPGLASTTPKPEKRKHIRVSDIVTHALPHYHTKPFRASVFAKAALSSAGLRCSERNLKNVYTLLGKRVADGTLHRVKRGLYSYTKPTPHEIANAPVLRRRRKKTSARGVSKK